MNIVALAGGVGGAKLADGLARCVVPFPTPADASRRPLPLPNLGEGGGWGEGEDQLTLLVNTGDDFDWMGLRVCPDLDTVMYTLAGLPHPPTGWGLAGDTFGALEMLGKIGGETWFRVGDRDLATHVRRTQLLRAGKRLTEATETLCRALGIAAHLRILPVADDPVPTLVETDEGTLAFQEYFVRRAWQPVIRRLHFQNVEQAQPSAEAQSALDAADLIVLCPSNPFVSIDPILALPGVRERLRHRRTVAVSPIIGGQAVKGPAAKMFRELGQEPSALAVARRYADFLDGIVIDHADAQQRAEIEHLPMRVLVTDTLMRDAADRERLAREVLAFETGDLKIEI